MRPPNKEEFSKLKVVLDCMLVVFRKFWRKTLSLICDLRQVKIYCMISKKFEVLIVFRRSEASVNVKVLIVFQRSEASVKVKVLIVFRRSEAWVKRPQRPRVSWGEIKDLLAVEQVQARKSKKSSVFLGARRCNPWGNEEAPVKSPQCFWGRGDVTPGAM